MIIILGLTYHNPYCSRLPVNYWIAISQHFVTSRDKIWQVPFPTMVGWPSWKKIGDSARLRLEQEMRRLCQISQIHTDTVKCSNLILFLLFQKGLAADDEKWHKLVRCWLRYQKRQISMIWYGTGQMNSHLCAFTLNHNDSLQKRLVQSKTFYLLSSNFIFNVWTQGTL